MVAVQRGHAAWGRNQFPGPWLTGIFPKPSVTTTEAAALARSIRRLSRIPGTDQVQVVNAAYDKSCRPNVFHFAERFQAGRASAKRTRPLCSRQCPLPPVFPEVRLKLRPVPRARPRCRTRLPSRHLLIPQPRRNLADRNNPAMGLDPKV